MMMMMMMIIIIIININKHLITSKLDAHSIFFIILLVFLFSYKGQ